MSKYVRRLVLNGPGRLEIKKEPFENLSSSLKANQVLLEMSHAPINPSDYYFTLNAYYDKKPFPCTPGFEGVGRVIKIGNSLNRQILGKWGVGHFFGSESGSFSSHSICDINNLILLQGKPEFSTFPFLINPLTALGLFTLARNSGGSSFIQNGASTSVGKLLNLVNHLSEKPLVSINIVRNDKHIDLLQKLGGKVILNQNEKDFANLLNSVVLKYNPKAAFDCLAGEHTGILLNSLQSDATLWVYGALDIKHCSYIDPQQLIFRGKQIKGFHVLKSFVEQRPVETFNEDLQKMYRNWNEVTEARIFEHEDYALAFKHFRAKNEKIILKLNDLD